VPYLVAGTTAGTLGALEQYKRLKTPITSADYAWAFWVLRVFLEVGIGLAAMLILKAADAGTAEEYPPLAWIIAGAAGPAIARIRIIDLGSSDDPTPFGLAAFYEPVRDWIAKQLDDIGAAALTRQVREDLLPLFNRAEVPPKDIGAHYMLWMQCSDRFSGFEEVDEQKYIDSTLTGSDPVHVQREVLVLRAVKLGAHRVLRDLRRSCMQDQN
jgi:hypothetical protein